MSADAITAMADNVNAKMHKAFKKYHTTL
jgi:hypothetical protein